MDANDILFIAGTNHRNSNPVVLILTFWGSVNGDTFVYTLLCIASELPSNNHSQNMLQYFCLQIEAVILYFYFSFIIIIQITN